MGRQLDTTGIYELLYRNIECARWEDVADRCLTCTNCTMVCPTCFCMTVVDTTDLTGQNAERTRHWDSCFTLDFSYIHGGSIRTFTEIALSPVDDSQTCRLAGSIRYFGVCGMWQMYNLVPCRY